MFVCKINSSSYSTFITTVSILHLTFMNLMAIPHGNMQLLAWMSLLVLSSLALMSIFVTVNSVVDVQQRLSAMVSQWRFFVICWFHVWCIWWKQGLCSSLNWDCVSHSVLMIQLLKHLRCVIAAQENDIVWQFCLCFCLNWRNVPKAVGVFERCLICVHVEWIFH